MLALILSSALSTLATLGTTAPSTLATLATTAPASSEAAMSAAVASMTAINGVWGDASWELRYGRKPTMADAPQERVAVHLAAVLERLQDADISHLSPGRGAARATALKALDAYIRSGAFPHNVDTPMSRPEFIDHQGNRCAVAALIEATLGARGRGTDAAEGLNALFERDSVWAMDDPAVARWADAHGLTETELAFIQPSYPPEWGDPRFHHPWVLGLRAGATMAGGRTYSSPLEGLTLSPEPAFDGAIYGLYQPSPRWGFGLSMGVVSQLDDFYEGSTAAVYTNFLAEYVLPLGRQGGLDLLFVLEGGGTFMTASPAGFKGLNYGGGVALTSNKFLFSRMAWRVDVRGRGHALWGDGDQSITGWDLLASLGLEWRFGDAW